jgi:hypothetical protein
MEHTEFNQEINIGDEREMHEVKTSNGDHTYVSWEGGYLERLMEKWATNAQRRVVLHARAERKYRCLHYSIVILSIVISMIAGTFSIGLTSLFSTVTATTSSYIRMAAGGGSLCAAFLDILTNLFKFERMCEEHRLASIQWNRFHRNIGTIMALDKSCRRNVSEFFRSAKAEMDRLVDNSPSLPDEDVTITITEQ